MHDKIEAENSRRFRFIPSKDECSRENERRIDMKIVEVKSVSSKPNPHNVDARSLSDTQSAQVVHITLQPGESLKKHITPVDVVFYVLEGQGVVEIGEERASVSADSLVESPAKIPHRWINESDAPFRVLVVKTPRPKEATKML
jgi:quercetin dioxygenase-like cupin family protein